MPTQLMRPLALSTSALLIATLAACAGSPPGDTPPEKAAVSFVRAIASGDGEVACPLITPEFLVTIKQEMEESGWAEETDGTCEGYIELASQIANGAGGLQVKAATSKKISSTTVEVIVSSKDQPDNAYVVKKVGADWLVHEHIDSEEF